MGRLEFRVWGRDLAGLAGRVRELAQPREVRRTVETYISTPSTAINPKIRADLLDVKVLLEVVDGFQRWEPRLKLEFPLKAESINRHFTQLLGVAPVNPTRSWYTAAEFVADVVVPHPELAAVEVSKRRTLFGLGGSLAEISEVVIGDSPLQTVAVESEQLADIRAAHRMVGMDRYQNRSYPDVLAESPIRDAALHPEESLWEQRSSASTS